MPSKPSRSEIESALSGQNERRKRATKKSASPELELDSTPRRRQVIGGDLTGVAGRPKPSILSRCADLGLPYWIGVALVALILLAFFWPKSGDSTREVIQAQALTQEALISNIEPIPGSEQPVVAENPVFTRDSDADRAEAFREQESEDRQIRSLIKKAEAHIAKGEYTEPKQGNAAQSYLAALAINPTNSEAKSGLNDLSDRFLTAGFGALENDNEALAKASLARLKKIDGSSEQTSELSDAIDGWQSQKKIEELLSKANTAFEAEALILPARKNALYYYREALAVDESNQAALAGIQDIADLYIARANAAVVEGKYQAAAAHLATVSVIDPNHASIQLIEAMLENATPIAAQIPPDNTDPYPVKADETPAPSNESTDSTIASDTNTSTNATEPPVQDIDIDTPLTIPATQPSGEKTPPRLASEQADFDRQYLKQGLEAYYKGEYDTAAALLQPLADKGIARAQFRLAYMHYLGRGFTANRQEADRMIRAALPAIRKFAEEGRAWAQSDLGSLYEDGLVLARDFAEAVYWYRSAAEQGYPGAQTNLGMMYVRGRGVTTSRRTAIEWFQRAAKQGDSVAKNNLEALGVN
ncbi:tetratricopeptide repeat protein [Arenicella xantha]|uniref:Sel1 repeat-containing protein n=1 Tax=Arenicella xantha TaxID=644221 RepID=A0A395JIZ0_9GAMM|nr:tetratricopeptide repeat protein [Arenicella xantha]RBP48601.1 Sel1 repeat-containing protein [Arenicella xantha]